MPRILTLLALLLLPSITLSHSGGLDANGGHHKVGQYHCHNEPCFSRQQVEAATKDAESSNTAYSRVYNRHDWRPHWSDHDGDCLNTRPKLLLDK